VSGTELTSVAAEPGSPLVYGDVQPGVLLWGRDSLGRWLPMIAESAIETPAPPKRHDFGGVYVRREGSEPPGVFWPLEDLRLRIAATNVRGAA
jgi:hypothetical protein